MRRTVDKRALDHQHKAAADGIGIMGEYFQCLLRGAAQVIFAPDRLRDIFIGHGTQQPSRTNRLRLFERTDDRIAAAAERITIRTALGGLLFEPPAGTYEHVDIARQQVARNGLFVAPIRNMRVKRSRGGMLEMAFHGNPRRHPFGHRPLDERLQTPAPGIQPQRAVIRLAPACQRRPRSRGIRHPVVGRIGRDQGNTLCPVESRRGIATFDGEHRNMRQAHAVADHINHIADTVDGFRSRCAACTEQAQRQKQKCFLHILVQR